MTVFSNIKYPISCPPTAQQLESLPEHLYKLWLTHGVGAKEYYSPATIATALKQIYSKATPQDIVILDASCQRLRDAIFALDE